jgi:hypothetical protein
VLQASVASIGRQRFDLGVDDLDADLPAGVLQPAHIRDNEGFEAINVIGSDLLIAPLAHAPQESVVRMGVPILEIDDEQRRISRLEFGIWQYSMPVLQPPCSIHDNLLC